MDFPVPVGEVILGTSVGSGPVRPCAPPRCVREGCVWMTTETTRLSVSVTADTGSVSLLVNVLRFNIFQVIKHMGMIQYKLISLLQTYYI